MTASAAARRPLLPPPVRAVLTALPRGITRLRHDPPPEPVALAGLVGLSLFALAVLLFLEPTVAPTETQVLPLILGGLLLGRRAFQWLSAVVALGLAAEVVVIGLGLDGVRPGALVVTAVTGLIAHEFARSREETGLSGASGEGLLVELRQRLEQQGQLPVLPPMWRAEAVLRPAGGGPFAGDFVVSGLTDGGRTLELALVDVSGKGVAAGTRALLMSGALGGLLGAVPHDQFLPAANSYLNCQDWEEGFATAVHLILDLVAGEFAVESAGHPQRPSSTPAAGDGSCCPLRDSHWAWCRTCGTPRTGDGWSVAMPCCCTPMVWWKCRAETSPWASTSCSARRTGWCRAGSPAVRSCWPGG